MNERIIWPDRGWRKLGDIYTDIFDITSEENVFLREPIPLGPYESPIEDKFAQVIINYLKYNVHFSAQLEITTIAGTFRPDFVLETDSGRIAFECDGKDYHEYTRDLCRDALILGSNGVDVIYRLTGTNINNIEMLNECLYLISFWEPQLFSERAHIQINTLASKFVKDYIVGHHQDEEEEHIIHYPNRSEHIDLRGVTIPTVNLTRRALRLSAAPAHSHFPTPKWIDVFKLGREKSVKNVDHLMEVCGFS